MTERVEVAVGAPASSANLGPGFDVFALALDLAEDVVVVRRRGEGVVVRLSEGSVEGVPEAAEENTCGVVALEMIRELGIRGGVEIELRKGVPVGVGLGSSGASAAAAALAMDRLFTLHLSEAELVRYAARGERVSAGAEHMDNVAASLLGGFVLVKPDTGRVYRVEPPRNLGVLVCIPSLPRLERKTERLRAVLPVQVPLRDAVMNLGNAAALLYGFMRGDVEAIGEGMCDVVVEPARAPFVPGYMRVREAALRAGAAGVALSGAGPSVLAIYDRARVEPLSIGEAMVGAFREAGVVARAYPCRPAGGARIL